MKISKVIVIIQQFAAIAIGSMLIGFGINGFLVPHHLLDGGIVGVALILHYYFHVQTGLCMIVLSIPLCLFAWYLERNYFFSSFHGLMVSSFFIDWLSPLQSQFPLPILVSSLLGGVINGVGFGLMLRFETSTAGTDLIAQMLSKTFTLNIGVIIFLIDGLVAVLGFQALGFKSFFYSCITIITVGVVTSMIVKNNDQSHNY
ncbi:hypothetical protein C0971_09300 [Bacillus methanolicus]|uniref:YitT family protein n=1 Tax=Bacillus methanolicus TaxID=1471 RepID=UPI0020102F95|nr:YitT family protein [Bacillus methanolicus]UQD52192.1 hypothetical protein C0971_09300 [Bacillus methanolicus]